MMSQSAQAFVDDETAPVGPMTPVVCECGHTVFDGLVIKSRVVRLLPRGGGEAKCRCKRWVPVPISYAPEFITGS